MKSPLLRPLPAGPIGYPDLRTGVVILFDNAQNSAVLSSWVRQASRHYLFKEKPANHWWPGDSTRADGAE